MLDGGPVADQLRAAAGHWWAVARGATRRPGGHAVTQQAALGLGGLAS
jgi:hypothetical protein